MKDLIVVVNSGVDGGKEQTLKAHKFSVVNEELHLHDRVGNMIACFAHQGWLSVRWKDGPPEEVPQDLKT